MAKTMTKITPVQIVTDEINCYATIQRAMIAAITACLRLQTKKGSRKHINPMLNKLREAKRWAENSYDACVDKYVDDAGNPAEG